MPLLLTLLVVAYLGSLWVSSRGGRSFGSPSGVEYVVLGALLGPRVLGVISDQAVNAFEPVAQVALGWLALGYGLSCGMLGEVRARASRILLGTCFAASTALVSASCAWLVASNFGLASGRDLYVLCASLGLVCAETTRHAFRWVSARHIARGPLAALVSEMAAADDAFVLVSLALVFAVGAGTSVAPFGLYAPPWALALGTLGIGTLIGGTCAFLLGRSRRDVEWWTLVLGSAWVLTGTMTKLGLSAMGATFAMGVMLSISSTNAATLRAMFARTEGPVLLPALLLAGAHLSFPASYAEGMLVAAAVAGRAAASALTGTGLALARPSTRPASRWLGLGMLSSGTLTMAVGFSIALNFGASIGRIALLVATAGTLLGELVGPFALRHALLRAGELSSKGDAPDEDADNTAAHANEEASS